ncbi:MAG: HEAT repeat domain-containing protein, partial [Candidatus Thorarchaeota archaeon]|nr:HEAT repeat domain-containing protein [Candidatus Thorarchaeota archaeon]
VQDKYVQGKFLDTLKNMVLSDFDIASEFVSRLERMNPEMQSKKEIAGFLELFKVIPLTLKQLQTVHPWVTSIAKKKLGKDQKDVVSEILSLEQVIPAITSEVMDTRKKAMNELSKIRIPSAVFPLLKALEDDHYYIREQVPKLIGNLGEGAVSNTISALQHEDHRVRIGAAEALGRLRFNYSVEPLIAALHDEHRIVRQNAAWALGRMHRYFSGKTLRKENVLEALENCMRNDDYLPARLNAVYSLGELDDPKVIKLLLEAMDYPEMEFRLNATHGFLKLSQLVPRDTKEGSQIIDRLIVALSDDAIRVVYNAVDGLRLFGGEKALEAVQKIKADNDPELVELVEDAIKEIKSMLKRQRSSWSYYERVHVQLRDPDVIEELIPLLMDESESNQRSTQIALGKFGSLAYDRMIELLADKEQNYLIRRGAAATLGEIGDKRATDILIETLNDEHDDVRCNAAWALAEIKDKRSLNALLKATNDTNWQVRLNAGAALGKIKGKGTLDALLKLSRDKHPQVRLVCMSFLGHYKSPRVLPALDERLKDQDSDVQKMARDWIKHLEKKE